MRKVLPLAVTAALVFLAVPAAAVPASASAGPSVTFSFAQPSIPSGVRPQLSYSATNLPGGSWLSLQILQSGPAQAWAYVETLNGWAGSARAPALPPGTYRFRIRALDGQRTVTISAARYLAVSSAPGSSGCTVCQLFGGLGGAILTWILTRLPW